MHARNIRQKAGCIGNRHHLDHGLRAIDEFDQHAGIHVATPRFLLVISRNRVKFQRVILALTGAHNVEAK